MASWNQFTGIGNCLQDTEIRNLPGGSMVATGGIACNRKYKTAGGEEREETLFLDYSCFGKLAEPLARFAVKGKQLFVAGRLVTESWDDKQGGGKRSKIKLMLDNFQLLGSREDGEAGREGRGRQGESTRQAEPARQTDRQARRQSPEPARGVVGEDDIPF